MRLAVLAAVLLLTAPTLLAAPATALVVHAPNADTGVPFQFTVRAIDSSNNTDTAYTGTIHFTSSDGAAVLPADYTFTPADQGVHTFIATLHGDNVTQTITATDTANSSITGTDGVFVVNPALVTSLQLVAPDTVVRGESVPVTVTARNARGETVPSYGGTVRFTSDKSVTLPPDYTFTPADQGSHTFSVIFHVGGENTLYVADVADSSLSGFAEVTVTCPDLTVSAFNSGPMCPDGVVTISAQTNATNPTFSWQHLRSGGPPPEGWPTKQSFLCPGDVSGNCSGTWEVIVTDGATGCIARAQTTVTGAPPPQLTFPEGEVVCEDDDMVVTLNNDPNGPYSDIVWSVSGATIVSGQGTHTITLRPANPVYRSDMRAAQYVDLRVTATRSATLCRQSVSTSAEFSAQAPVLTVDTPDSMCAGSVARATLLPPPQNPPPSSSDRIETVEWFLTNATEVARAGFPEYYIDFIADGTGPVSVTATYTTFFGTCARSVTETISVNGGSATIVVADSVCPNSGHTASVGNAGPGATYSWTISNGEITSGQGTPSITWTSGIASAQLGVTVSANGCTRSASKTVLVSSPATIVDQPDDDTVASGSTATLQVGATGDNLVYQWYEGSSGDVSKPVGSNSPTFTTPPLQRTTSYWVSVRNGCSSVASEAAVVTVAVGRRRAVGRG